MKALVLRKPGQAFIEPVPDPVLTNENLLLKVRMVGFCGSDLNSFRGVNPLISFARILRHDVCASVVAGINVDDSKPAQGRKAGGVLAINTNRQQMKGRVQVMTEEVRTEVVMQHLLTPAAFRAAVVQAALPARVVDVGYANGAVACERRM